MRAALLALTACWTRTAPPPPPTTKPPAPRGPNIASLTPAGIDRVWLSMPHATFVTARPQAKRVHDDDRWRYLEPLPGGRIEQAEYVFSALPPHPLYEIRARYEDQTHAEFALHQRYTTLGLVTGPAFSDPALSYQVVIKTPQFDVGVWTYGATLIVAAALPNTERAGNKFQEPLP